MIAKCRNHLVAYIRECGFNISREWGPGEVNGLVNYFGAEKRAQIKCLDLGQISLQRNQEENKPYFFSSIYY